MITNTEVKTILDEIAPLTIHKNLPLYYHPNYKYEIKINNKNFILVFKWNDKFSYWTIEFYDDLKIHLCTSKLVPEKDIISNYRYKIKLPNTQLYTSKNNNDNEYPTQFDVESGFYLVSTNIPVILDGTI